MTSLSSKIRSFNPAPITAQADAFELARARVERDFVVLTDGETLKLTHLLHDEEVSPRQKENAYALLHRAAAPLALLAARDNASKFQSFEAAHSAAEIALWTTLRRWDPKKGMRLSTFVRLTLPVELERERKASEVIDRMNWAEITLKAAMHVITETGHNRLFLTNYTDAEGTVTVHRLAGKAPQFTLAFPLHATVTYLTTAQGNLIEKRATEATERNPMLAWFTNMKATTVKTFSTRTRNWPRKQDRSKTGYKLSAIQKAGEDFITSTFGTKLTSRLMRARVFHKPFRPIRQDEITPRMLQDVMRRDRVMKQQPFDEKAWSITRIADLMQQLHTVTSYDIALSDDEGDETRLLDFIAAPEHDEDDTEIETLQDENGEEQDVIKPRFNEGQLDDSQRITERLQASGLWEMAMNIPLKKFLNAYDAGRPGFCTLCSRYGIRVKHGLQIVRAIEATLR